MFRSRRAADSRRGCFDRARCQNGFACPSLFEWIAALEAQTVAKSLGEIEAFAAELIDRFGPLPEEVENLLQIIAIKALCKDAGVERIEAGPKGALVSFHGDRVNNLEGLVAFVQQQAGAIKLRPDHKLVYRHDWDDPQVRVAGVQRLLGELGKVAG